MKISTILVSTIVAAISMSGMAETDLQDHNCPMPAQIKKVGGIFVGTDQEGGIFKEKFRETKAKNPGQFSSASHYAPGVSPYGQIACNYTTGATLWLTQPTGKVTTAHNKKWQDDMCFSSDPVDCLFGVDAK